MKKDNTYIYGIIAYIGVLLGSVLSAVAESAAASVIAAVGAVVCAVVGFAAIVKSMSNEQKLLKK